MGPSELLEHVVAVFEGLGKPYLVTGSVAAMAYGEPRLTNDIDIVAGITEQHLPGLLAAFPAENFEADFAAPEDAIIKKMEHYREGGSEKHLRDTTGIPLTSGAEVDRAYIGNWARQLGLGEIWEAIEKRLRS